MDFSILKKTWVYSKADFAAVSATIIVTLGWGVDFGITAGIAISIIVHLYKSSRPHIAEVGQVPGTEHYRNVLRHDVTTYKNIFTLRVDESLFFANARYLEDYIYRQLANRPELEHVVIMCSAVNEIDMSALESIEAINERLGSMDVKLHFSEVKGPVMDRLKRTEFVDQLSGEVFLSQHEAIMKLRDAS